MRLLWFTSIIVLLSGCLSPDKNPNFEKLISTSPYSVVMFLAPDCPLCMTLTTPFSNLQAEYPNVQFLGVISGKHYEAMEINMYATEKAFKPAIFRDYDYAVAQELSATVTPEFVLLDSSGNIYYQGMMDDRILALGSYKQRWDKHYLRDAIEAVTRGGTPTISSTEPIGCVLEY